jgi:hypothetical protein
MAGNSQGGLFQAPNSKAPNSKATGTAYDRLRGLSLQDLEVNYGMDELSMLVGELMIEISQLRGANETLLDLSGMSSSLEA